MAAGQGLLILLLIGLRLEVSHYIFTCFMKYLVKRSHCTHRVLHYGRTVIIELQGLTVLSNVV